MNRVIYNIRRDFFTTINLVKTRHCFDDEEAYLIYLATSSKIGPRTKILAKQKLETDYPDGVYSLWAATRPNPEYSLRFKYKLCKNGSPIPSNRLDTNEFMCRVSYKLFDENGYKVLSRFNRPMICAFNNGPMNSDGEINPLYDLTYDDLTEDIKVQIIQKSLRELVTIDYKLLQYKWSTWEEMPIEIIE